MVYLILKSALLLSVNVFSTHVLTGHFRIQFLKQGPAYKREGPDPNKGSN